MSMKELLENIAKYTAEKDEADAKAKAETSKKEPQKVSMTADEINTLVEKRLEDLLSKYTAKKEEATEKVEKTPKVEVSEKEQNLIKKIVKGIYLENNGIEEAFDLFYSHNKDVFAKSKEEEYDLNMKSIITKQPYMFGKNEKELTPQEALGQKKFKTPQEREEYLQKRVIKTDKGYYL